MFLEGTLLYDRERQRGGQRERKKQEFCIKRCVGIFSLSKFVDGSTTHHIKSIWNWRMSTNQFSFNAICNELEIFFSALPREGDLDTHTHKNKRHRKRKSLKMFRQCCWVFIEWFGFRDKIFSISKVFGCLFRLFSPVEAFRFRSTRRSYILMVPMSTHHAVFASHSSSSHSILDIPIRITLGLFCRQLCYKTIPKINWKILASLSFHSASFSFPFPFRSSAYIV